jgi:uncharacterized protein (TIGR02284 family)
MTAHNETLAVLGELIELSNEEEIGCQLAATEVHNRMLREMLIEHAIEFDKRSCELAERLQTLSPDYDLFVIPDDGHTIKPLDHRALVTAIDDASIVDVCERAERMAKMQYRRALRRHLPGEINEFLLRQYEGVVRAHEQVAQLKYCCCAQVA